MQQYQHIQLSLKPQFSDVVGNHIAQNTQNYWQINTGKVKTSTVFSINYPIEKNDLQNFAHLCLKDAIVDNVTVNQLSDTASYQSYIAVAKLPGVTDDEGTSAQKALCDFLNLDIDTNTQHIFTQSIFYIENSLSEKQLRLMSEKLLGNPLIHHFQYGSLQQSNGTTPADLVLNNLYVPEVQMTTDTNVQYINLNISDEALLALSKDMLLALNLHEMKAIQAHYNSEAVQAQRKSQDLSLQPSDCELEILAQTWSEHCKHKEFNAIIHYNNEGEEKTITSLFKTFIKGATDKVHEQLKANDNNWLVKVFTDNAGTVKINDKLHFVWKVETHNSPSALDPYGGAITGILGNNRDPLGTGIGGTRLLFNTNVLCFGSPYFDGQLLTGQLHPKRIFSGVRHGIEDGGNKSGIPTVNGAIVFDDRYRGKPLVYCGTGGIISPSFNGRNTWEKPIDAGDLIVMGGGRVGKDGIHGATFSSVEIDEHSPQSAVQIGSPITQKLLNDFLIKACETGLVKSITDNGAGGLSSSIGELATISGGAVVQLEKVPLKYAGLQPWEIFVSESQERMTFVIEPAQLAPLMDLAQAMEVELSHIGQFTDSGFLDVRYNDAIVALIDMDFLHDGVPTKIMEAEWTTPTLHEPTDKAADYIEQQGYGAILLQLMGSLNICSREHVIRQYDHEVKGRTVLKPLMGSTGKAPQDAAVVRVGFDTNEGIAVSNGILPRYGDIDAYEMSAGAFDEAVRQIISVGGKLPNQAANDGVFWSVNDNFCVPDSEYHPTNNPDGKQKLAKLIQMCEALYDMATYFDIPLTSGKDSMKNDYKGDGVKISIPPTILYSMAAKIDHIGHVVSSDFKQAGDLIYQLGNTYDELGGSEFYLLIDELGANVPKVRKAQAKKLYQKVMQANSQHLIESSHDLSDGGLAVALVEAGFGNPLGFDINTDAFGNDLALHAILFSESHSRFVVSIRAENKAIFEQLMGSDAFLLGKVTSAAQAKVSYKQANVIDLPLSELLEAWDTGLPSDV